SSGMVEPRSVMWKKRSNPLRVGCFGGAESGEAAEADMDAQNPFGRSVISPKRFSLRPKILQLSSRVPRGLLGLGAKGRSFPAVSYRRLLRVLNARRRSR